jgi:anti-sigma-K factor RskA
MSGYPASLTREMQRDAELAEAVADWRKSHSAIDRRWAMRLLAAERARRSARRAELAAATRSHQRIAA